MDKILAEHRTRFGDFEVVDVDDATVQSLRQHVDVDTPVNVHWAWEYGETVAELRRLYEKGIASILDYAVEGSEDEDEFDDITAEILRAVDAAIDLPEVAFVAVKLTGIIRFGLLERLDATGGAGDELSESERAELARGEARLDSIAEHAARPNT